MSNRPGTHADGYRWLKDVISNRNSHTLENQDGWQVAHVIRVNDGTYTVIDAGTGEAVAARFTKVGEALKAAENTYRPCAYVDIHSSHGIVPCDLDRVPQSIYCTKHREGTA